MESAAIFGCAIGTGIGVLHAVIETFAYKFFLWMERRRIVHRLISDIPPSKTAYEWENFSAVAVPYTLLFTIVGYFRHGFIDRIDFAMNPVQSYVSAIVIMLCHDLWFFLCHTFMHYFKTLYRVIHLRHHKAQGDLTIFDTTAANISDHFLSFTLFHAILLTVLYCMPSWNIWTIVLFTFAEISNNLIGHSGYYIPYWLHLIMTFGLRLIPYSQTSTTHYIHHVDPRYNRALYFTWWDRLWGTFREAHPRIKLA